MLFIFDMGGVVTNTFKIEDMVRKIGISKEDFWNICKKGERNFWDEAQKGLIGSKEFWKLFNEKSEEYGFKPVLHDLFRLFFNPVRKPLTEKLILELKKNNRVVCGTNTMESHYKNHTEKGDYKLFHKLYASNEMQVVKPDADFFRIIMEKEGYKPEETFFTDDRVENCDAAKALGINTVLFTAEEDLYKKWEIYIK